MRKTVLNPVHRDLGGRMVEFGGFDMPVQYSSIVEEHQAVRQGAGLFDLCHMGRFEINGAETIEAVDRLVTCNVSRMNVGQIRYGLVTNEQGGVHDDILVYRMPESVVLVVNAGNRDKLLPYFEKEFGSRNVQFRDRSEELAMIAVQGPRAESLLSPGTTTRGVAQLADLGYYHICEARMEYGGKVFDGWVSRTGYTGEDGFELYVDNEHAIALWAVLQEIHGDALQPCGLGSRDTLRLEAGMPLYGHELEEDITPYEAGLGFAVKLKKKTPFVGRDVLAKVKQDGPPRTLRGFIVDGKRVARQGMPIMQGDNQVGVVTSGAPSPTLSKNIAMGFVDSAVSEDAPLEADVRGRRAPLAPHAIPFYKRAK